jgi:competence protein ComEA
MQDVSERTSDRSKSGWIAAGDAWPWTIEVRRLLCLATLGAAPALLALGRNATPPIEGDSRPAPALVVDLNTAPAELFSALPGIGPTLAARIVEARRERPFASLDDLERRTKGIGPATMARLSPHLRIEPPRGKADPQVVRTRGGPD